MLGVVVVVLLGVVCVRDQVTPWVFRSLVRMAKKGCFSLVGTAAVVGLSETVIPESMKSEIVCVPFLLESPTACTVMMIVSPGNLVGSGRMGGAVKVSVPVICSFDSVPKVPSVGHLMAVAVTGVPEELVVVVV